MKKRLNVIFNFIIVLILVFSSQSVFASEDKLETQKIKESYEKLDKLVLKLRKAHNNDWEKIDKIVESSGYKVAVASSKKYSIKDDGSYQLLSTGDINNADFSVEMRVYLDMGGNYYHVRAYWDWNSTDYMNYSSTPEDAAGIGTSKSLQVLNGSYVTSINSEDWIDYSDYVTIHESPGDGRMSIKIQDYFFDRDRDLYYETYNAHHGMFGYSLSSTPTETVSFEAKYSHSWSSGSLQSLSASYPGGINVTYSSSTSHLEKSSTSLTITDWSQMSYVVTNP